MIEFLSGALTLGYVVVGALFLSFAVAFWLFALNQYLTFYLSADREIQIEYVLRVLGFLVILVGIARKNAEGKRS
jgi:hypothetical protein